MIALYYRFINPDNSQINIIYMSYLRPNINPTPVARRSFVGPSSVSRNTTSLQPPILTTTPTRITGGNIRSGRASIVGSKLTAIQNPPVYEVVEHPPLIEAVTTPPKVYQIVKPIIQVTPDVVTQKVVKRYATPPPTIIPRKARGARGNFEQIRPGTGCPWWICPLLACLLLTALLSGLLFAFRDKLGFGVKSETEPSKPQSEQRPQPHPEEQNNDDQKQDEGQVRVKKDNGQNLVLKSGRFVNNEEVPNQKERNIITITNVTCQKGYFFHKNKCVSCPNDSVWNGEQCIKKVNVAQSQGQSQQTKGKTQSLNANNIQQKIQDPWSVVKPKQQACSDQIEPIVPKAQQKQTTTTSNTTTTTISSSSENQKTTVTAKNQETKQDSSAKTTEKEDNVSTDVNKQADAQKQSKTTTTTTTTTTPTQQSQSKNFTIPVEKSQQKESKGQEKKQSSASSEQSSKQTDSGSEKSKTEDKPSTHRHLKRYSL